MGSTQGEPQQRNRYSFRIEQVGGETKLSMETGLWISTERLCAAFKKNRGGNGGNPQFQGDADKYF